MTPMGRKAMGELVEGDLVQVMKSDGSISFSKMLMFLHYDPSPWRPFVHLHTSGGANLIITPSHLLLHAPLTKNSTVVLKEVLQEANYIPAENVQLGDFLIVVENSVLTLQQVIEVQVEYAFGEYAPLTTEGTVIVEGVVASCYAQAKSHTIAHLALAPVRVMDAVSSLLRISYTEGSSSLSSRSILPKDNSTSCLEESSPRNPIHWYPKGLHTLTEWVMPSLLQH